MKAIIVAAGKTLSAKDGKPWYSNLYFPENSKPKCLFHYGGETVLKRQVRVLRKCGLTDIRIVVGYKKELIKRFIEEKNLGLEVVENPRAIYDRLDFKRGWMESLQSVKVGLEGIGDAVLILMGDVLLTEEALKAVLEVENPNVAIAAHLFKTSKEKLPLLRKFCACKEGCLCLNLYEFVRDNNGTVIVSELEHRAGAWHDIPGALIIQWKTELVDLDFYTQTDEYKEEHK